MSIVEQAKQFAIKHHGDQKYGKDDSPVPYSYHLQMAHDVVVEFLWASDDWSEENTSDEIYALRAAAWLHDVIEDTPVTFELVFNEFGRNISRLVWAVTNMEEDYDGNRCNRKKKAYYTWPKIRAAGREALALKLADRIANVRHSVQHNHSMVGMYKKEYKKFREYLRIPGELKAMWAELDKLHNHFVEE